MNNGIPGINSNLNYEPTITFTNDKNYKEKKVETVNLNNLDNNYKVVDNGKIFSTKIDISKVADSINNLKENNYYDIRYNDNFYGEIEYIMWDDGTVVLQKDGVTIGYTSYDAIGKAKPITIEKDAVEPRISLSKETRGNDTSAHAQTLKDRNNNTTENNRNNNISNSNNDTSAHHQNMKDKNHTTNVTKQYEDSGRLDGSNLDLSQLATTASNVKEGNFVNENKLNKDSFNKDLDYEVRKDGTVLISAAGIALGFTTTAALEKALGGKLRKKGNSNNDTSAHAQSSKDKNHSLNNNNKDTSSTNTKTANNKSETENNNSDSSKNDDFNNDISMPQTPNNSAVVNENVDVSVTNQKKADAIENTNSIAVPNDYNFKHNESNILAAKAKNMGFTDEQIKIAIGISRWETGNYQHLAGGNNFGGVTGSGDLGQSVFYGSDGKKYVYAKYSSKDVGMDAYLYNLKKNYFDKGLTSVEKMARIYLGHDNTSSWINGVYDCMS